MLNVEWACVFSCKSISSPQSAKNICIRKQKNKKQYFAAMIGRLKYHAAIFLVVCNGIAAVKTARLTGHIHSKGYRPFLPRNAAMNAARCMRGCVCVYSPDGTVFATLHPDWISDFLTGRAGSWFRQAI